MGHLMPIALRFLAQGISVVPVANDGSKRPKFAWERFKKELPIADELLMWFKDGVNGIGVVICYLFKDIFAFSALLNNAYNVL